MPFAGIQIRESVHLVDTEKWIQVRFPRSKKRRIRRKWAWRSENWAHPPLDKVLLVGDVAYCHPQFVGQLRESLAAAFPPLGSPGPRSSAPWF